MNFFRKFFGSKRNDARLEVEGTVCGFQVRYKGGYYSALEYGPCNVYRIINISSAGIAIRHNNSIKKGDMLEFRTKYCIKDKKCFSCPHFPELEEKLSVAPFIGKVVWRNDFMAGFNIIQLAGKDRVFLEKMARLSEP